MRQSPSITGKKLIRILKKLGFEVIRVKGSHHFLKHTDGRCTVVPVHRGDSIGRGLLHRILKDCDVSHEEFHDLL